MLRFLMTPSLFMNACLSIPSQRLFLSPGEEEFSEKRQLK